MKYLKILSFDELTPKEFSKINLPTFSFIPYLEVSFIFKNKNYFIDYERNNIEIIADSIKSKSKVKTLINLTETYYKNHLEKGYSNNSINKYCSKYITYNSRKNSFKKIKKSLIEFYIPNFSEIYISGEIENIPKDCIPCINIPKDKIDIIHGIQNISLLNHIINSFI